MLPPNTRQFLTPVMSITQGGDVLIGDPESNERYQIGTIFKNSNLVSSHIDSLITPTAGPGKVKKRVYLSIPNGPITYIDTLVDANQNSYEAMATSDDPLEREAYQEVEDFLNSIFGGPVD